MSFPPTHAGGGAGTPGYMAPELFSGHASKEAVMYAFGVVVYEVITGTRPFGDRRLVELPRLTLQGLGLPTPEDPVAAGFCQGTWEFAERCWNENPGQRPVARQAVEHFERAAKSSTVVDPGPTIPVHEPVYSSLGASSRGFCQYYDLTRCLYSDSAPARLFATPSTSNTGTFRQGAYATRVLVSNQAVPVPTLQAIREPTNPLRRMFHNLISPRSAPRLEPSPQGGN
jgi:serine/threonine protein kinase